MRNSCDKVNPQKSGQVAAYLEYNLEHSLRGGGGGCI